MNYKLRPGGPDPSLDVKLKKASFDMKLNTRRINARETKTLKLEILKYSIFNQRYNFEFFFSVCK